MGNIDFYDKLKQNTELVEVREDDKKMTYTKIPLSDLIDLGGRFAEVASEIEKIKIQSTPDMYRMVNIYGRGHLADFKDGSGKLGTIVDEKGIVGQARWIKVDKVTNNGNNAPILISLVGTAVAFLIIERKVSNLQSGINRIERALEINAESQLEAVYNSLFKLLREYPFIENDKDYVIAAKYSDIRECGKMANKIAINYRKKIEDTVKSGNLWKKQFQTLAYYFEYYYLALKVYSLSLFLEILYSGNANHSHIQEQRDDLYRMVIQFTETIELLKKVMEENGDKTLKALNNEDTFGVIVNGLKLLGSSLGAMEFEKILEIENINLFEDFERIDYLDSLVTSEEALMLEGDYLYLLSK